MGRLISVLDTDQSYSKSLLIVNLAIIISAQVRKETVIADFDFVNNSDIPVLLNFQPERSLGELLEAYDKSNSISIGSFLGRYKSEVLFMAAGKNPEGLESDGSYRNMKKAAAQLKETYEWVLANINNNLDENALCVLDLSDMVLLVIEPHIFSMNRTKIVIERLKSIHYPVQAVKVIISNSNIKGSIEKEEIERFIGYKIFAEILYDPESTIPSVNEGKPAVELFPHSDYSRSIKELAFVITKEQERFLKEGAGFFSEVGQLLKERYTFNQEPDSKQIITEGSDVSKEQIITELKKRIHKRLISEFNLKSLDLKGSSDPKKLQEVRNLTREKIEDLLAEEAKELDSREERSQLVSQLLDEILGLGPLEILLKEEEISEIMVNGKDKIYIEKKGKIQLSDIKFDSDSQIVTIIDRILAPIGRRVDESSPLVDARLSDGSRVNVVIPPLALVGPTITIRKFVANRLGFPELIKFNSITQDMVDFLKVCVLLRKNIIVSGGTGSGKTTLLNMLSSFIPSDERIVTIEDSAELKLKQDHVVTLESRPPSIEGTGEISIRRLVVNSLRMRPDRIIVGECRSGETLDMLQAMNTGHDGSLTTVHANTPKDTISRITTMVIMAGTELPERAIREQIVGAIDLIVQISRFSDGSRKVTHITEVATNEKSEMVLYDIFRYKQTGLENTKVIGEMKATGTLPTFFEEIKAHGLEFDKNKLIN